jgi:hypothetical protein
MIFVVFICWTEEEPLCAYSEVPFLTANIIWLSKRSEQKRTP